MEGRYGNPVAGGGALSMTPIGAGGIRGFLAGVKAPSDEEQKANADAQTERKELAQQTAEQIRRIREQADEAERTGIARLEYERSVALADLVREHIASTDTIRYIDRKYYAEEKNSPTRLPRRSPKPTKKCSKPRTKRTRRSCGISKSSRIGSSQLASEAAMQGMGTISRIHAEAQQQKARLLRRACQRSKRLGNRSRHRHDQPTRSRAGG